MDRALKEERAYTLDLCKQIKKAGCNVLLIQKSILRYVLLLYFLSAFSDAISELALHFFAKMKIMVIKDIEREDIEFYSSILGCRPVASADHFTAESLGSAELVEEITTSGTEKVVKVTGLQNEGKAVSILLRGSNKLVLDEADRSIHDALCVLRCLIKKRALLPGGGAPEMEVAVQLRKLAEEKVGAEHYCWKVGAILALQMS
jgi:T-complex protein 1 subunit delta